MARNPLIGRRRRRSRKSRRERLVSFNARGTNRSSAVASGLVKRGYLEKKMKLLAVNPKIKLSADDILQLQAIVGNRMVVKILDAQKQLETMKEQTRNKRQMVSTAFQNSNKKSNQLINLLSRVMKTMNDMRKGTVRNIR